MVIPNLTSLRGRSESKLAPSRKDKPGKHFAGSFRPTPNVIDNLPSAPAPSPPSVNGDTARLSLLREVLSQVLHPSEQLTNRNGKPLAMTTRRYSETLRCSSFELVPLSRDVWSRLSSKEWQLTAVRLSADGPS